MSQRYYTKSQLRAFTGRSADYIRRKVRGIENEVGGRYNEYAIIDGAVNIAVFLDYTRYYKALEDRNARKTVPPFNMYKALEYAEELAK